MTSDAVDLNCPHAGKLIDGKAIHTTEGLPSCVSRLRQKASGPIEYLQIVLFPLVPGCMTGERLDL